MLHPSIYLLSSFCSVDLSSLSFSFPRSKFIFVPVYLNLSVSLTISISLFVYLCLNLIFSADLRDDKQFFIDHPGAMPITTAQVRYPVIFECSADNINLSEVFLRFSSAGRRASETDRSPCLRRMQLQDAAGSPPAV